MDERDYVEEQWQAANNDLMEVQVMERDPRFEVFTMADLRWWDEVLVELAEQVKGQLDEARNMGASMLVTETIADRLDFIYQELGYVLDEFQRRNGHVVRLGRKY